MNTDVAPSVIPVPSAGSLAPLNAALAPAGLTHTVQFYNDPTFLLDEASRWVGAALGAGDAVVVLATPAHREGIAARLRERGLDVEHAVQHGRYLAHDAAEMLARCLSDDGLDPTCFTEVIGGLIRQAETNPFGDARQVTVYGELVTLLAGQGQYETALHLEELWNDLARTHAFRLHCGYPMSAFPRAADGDALQRICAVHTEVVPLESYTSLIEEADRLRSVAILQQQAQTLAAEVAARERVDRELLERNRELQDAVAARDEFLSVAAHELKTPVTSLRGFTQLLLRDVRRGREIAPDRLARSLDTIERQTGKLSQLVTRLLDTAQIEAGKLRVEPVPTDLVGLVRSAVAQQPLADQEAIVVDAPMPLVAAIDPVRFEQVVTNLLDNAVKHSPVDGTVTVAMSGDGADGVRLTVTDEGVGIPPAQREVVFSRFQQGNRQHHLSGLGLGLYISRQIVEMHGGALRIEDAEHPGARFVVTLPHGTASMKETA